MNDKKHTYNPKRFIQPFSDEALRQLTRDMNNVTPSSKSFDEMLKEFNNA